MHLVFHPPIISNENVYISPNLYFYTNERMQKLLTILKMIDFQNIKIEEG
jgi:hypothetical protein